MENIPLNANRHLRFQKCLPTESSQSANRVANRTGSVNIRLPLISCPDRSIRMDDLRAGRAVSRRYRNRRIGEFLKELDLTEGRSTGIPKILREMAANGSPAPEFDSDDDRTYYLVRLPAHPRAETTDPVSDHVAGEAISTGQVTGHADSWILDVLRACHFSPRKSSEIQALTGIKHRETFQRNYLDRLIEEDWIERTIPDKPTSRLQKYRLTEKGRKLLGSR